jgi:hypothetical protein
VFECAGDDLVLQGDGQHDHLLVVAGFVFCHRVLWLIKPHDRAFVVKFPAFSTVSTAGVTRKWAGVDSVWEQKKIEARKMLENAAESHTSGARFVGQHFVWLFVSRLAFPLYRDGCCSKRK